jgi:hypothetical protein
VPLFVAGKHSFGKAKASFCAEAASMRLARISGGDAFRSAGRDRIWARYFTTSAALNCARGNTASNTQTTAEAGFATLDLEIDVLRTLRQPIW